MKKSITSLLFMFALALAGSVAAQGVGVDVSVQGGGSASSGQDRAAEAQLNAEAGATVGGSASEQGTMRGESETKRAENAPVTDDETQGNTVSVFAVQVRGWDAEQKKEFLATVKAHAQVRSGQDLENFAKGVLLKDENVSQVSYDDEQIVVKYKGKGKLLGSITVPYTHRVVVDVNASATERVKFKFPWYSFLVKSGLDAAEIEAEITALLSSNLTAQDMGAKVSAYAKAFSSIANVLKTKNEVEADAMASVE